MSSPLIVDIGIARRNTLELWEQYKAVLRIRKFLFYSRRLYPAYNIQFIALLLHYAFGHFPSTGGDKKNVGCLDGP